MTTDEDHLPPPMPEATDDAWCGPAVLVAAEDDLSVWAAAALERLRTADDDGELVYHAIAVGGFGSVSATAPCIADAVDTARDLYRSTYPTEGTTR